MTTNPAAGPETPNDEPLKPPTTIPPIIPAIIPEKRRSGLPVDANATPKHKGSATKKTTNPAGKSDVRLVNIFNFLKLIIM